MLARHGYGREQAAPVSEDRTWETDELRVEVERWDGQRKLVMVHRVVEESDAGHDLHDEHYREAFRKLRHLWCLLIEAYSFKLFSINIKSLLRFHKN